VVPPKQMQKLFKGLIKGLLYLQDQGIVHRDIKPDNILLTTEGAVKIGDFGVAVRIDANNDDQEIDLFRTAEGSVAFQPPECQEFLSPRQGSNPDFNTKRKISREVTQKLDVWAAGVVLYIMATGKYPFENPNIMTLFANIARGEFTIPESISDPDLCDLIKGTLRVSTESRLSLLQIKKHPWMKAQLPSQPPTIPIPPIHSAFGHDSDTLLKVLEDVQNQEDEEDSENAGDSIPGMQENSGIIENEGSIYNSKSEDLSHTEEDQDIWTQSKDSSENASDEDDEQKQVQKYPNKENESSSEQKKRA